MAVKSLMQKCQLEDCYIMITNEYKGMDMELISTEIAKNLPKINEGRGTEKQTLLVRLYTPWVFQSWEIAEYDPEKRLCYGWICGYENDWGYFSLDELEKIQGPQGKKVLRDIDFKPVLFSKIGR